MGERPFTIEQLDHIVLFVEDVKKSADFYTMLGGVPRENPGRSTIMSIGASQRILLHPDPEHEPPAEHSRQLQHLNLLIKGPRNMAEVVDYITANGVEICDPPRGEERGIVQIRVLDPDGNQVEIRLPTPAE